MYAFWLGYAILCTKKLFQQSFVYVEKVSEVCIGFGGETEDYAVIVVRCQDTLLEVILLLPDLTTAISR